MAEDALHYLVVLYLGSRDVDLEERATIMDFPLDMPVVGLGSRDNPLP